jgi:dTDP-4-amino-4,6-dideoxygalactose transaminase
MVATDAAAQLAMLGGEAEVKPEWRHVQHPTITPSDTFALMRVIKSGVLMSIEKNEREIPNLEREYGRYAGVKGVLAMASGTAALHAAVAACGVGPGDEVIVPALSFLASATAVMHHQGIPVFVDIDPVTFNIDPAKVVEKISDRTKAIQVVHLHGLPADMDPIRKIADEHGLKIIEDFAQAHGASYKGQKAGALGDVGGGSIMADKNLAACGEGGLLTTNSAPLRARAEELVMFNRSVLDAMDDMSDAEDVGYTMGWSYRISPLHAAFARSQLRRLDAMNELRTRNAAMVSATLNEIGWMVPPHVPAESTHAYYLYRFKVDPFAAGIDVPVGRLRKAVQDALLAEGVMAREWQNTPLPGQPLFQTKTGYGNGCPWTCKATNDVEYRIDDYPATLAVIEESLVLGREVLMAPDADQVRAVCRAFEKVATNLPEIAGYARELDYQPPWIAAARLA